MERKPISEITKLIGEKIKLCGWVDSRRDHGQIIFIDLRDKSGVAQLVFNPENKAIYEKANILRSEWVISVEGEVKARPKGMQNPKIATGEIEILVETLEVLSEAKTLPFEINNDGYQVNEEIRMKYRYLDLRRERLRKNLIARHKIIKFIRDWMGREGFTEIETPILTKSTPEGARDYIVPARLSPGKFYALPQSPQQYKQLLMVAGLEKYFQIARCFRDEDTRGDRQPEFTQLDIEMSFVDEEDVLKIIEGLYIDLIKTIYQNKKIKQIPFPHFSYQEVMEKYKSDKPDLRDAQNNPDELAFCFVRDFPMFEWKENEKRWDATHHPFTRPNVKDAKEFREKFRKDPGSIFAKQYDLVLNGYEIAGGSVRTSEAELLAAVFEAMGHKQEDIKRKFGHMLEAFSFGVPPHGGIASGLDRVIAILQNEPNIREVIPFPKTGDGRDLMMNAPSEVDESQLKELHLKTTIK